jgi:2-C-methyl-D-erythritol 4-phosphate cytidylyltransferase
VAVPTAAAVVLAGGSGTRVGGTGNKVYLPLAGHPLLWWTLRAFVGVPAVARLVLAVRPADLDLAAGVVAELAAPVEIITGGTTRHGSEEQAVAHLAPAIRAGELDVVAIHDAARPLISPALIAAIIDAAHADGGAIPGLPADDAAHAEGGAVTGRLVRVQTPQAFAARALLAAYGAAAADGFAGTDTAACLERYAAVTVRVLPGDPRNIKVTYPADLLLAEHLLGAGQQRLGQPAAGRAADRESQL